jgi:anti-sigma factor RsiW
MSHPPENEVLLLAYGELPVSRAVEIEAHTAACQTCREKLTQLERGRVALDVAMPARRRASVWATVGLATAAMLAAIVTTDRQPANTERHSEPPTMWSATAGYIAGGPAAVEIDETLTRLEQGWSYGRP